VTVPEQTRKKWSAGDNTKLQVDDKVEMSSADIRIKLLIILNFH